MRKKLTLTLEAGYRQMSQNEPREAAALEWAEATTGDVAKPPSAPQKRTGRTASDPET